jgi:formylmethanofuran dehydrogenase subunit E
MDQYPPAFRYAIRFHGHVCPGLIIGYRAAKVVRSAFRVERSEDEELVAIVENDACSVDAIQVLLGCTLGKGNLIYRDYGKQVYTIVSRESNRAIRIALKSTILGRPSETEALFQKAQENEASAEEREALDDFRKKRMKELLEMDEETLFKIEDVQIDMPEKARIFKSVLCHYCGERVMEPRARIRDGKIACIPCSEEYTRGW